MAASDLLKVTSLKRFMKEHCSAPFAQRPVQKLLQATREIYVFRELFNRTAKIYKYDFSRQFL